MYPDRDTLSNVPRSGDIAARDQSMESGIWQKVGKTLPGPASFLFREWTQQHQTWSLKLKSNDF